MTLVNFGVLIEQEKENNLKNNGCNISLRKAMEYDSQNSRQVQDNKCLTVKIIQYIQLNYIVYNK